MHLRNFVILCCIIAGSQTFRACANKQDPATLSSVVRTRLIRNLPSSLPPVSPLIDSHSRFGKPQHHTSLEPNLIRAVPNDEDKLLPPLPASRRITRDEQLRRLTHGPQITATVIRSHAIHGSSGHTAVRAATQTLQKPTKEVWRHFDRKTARNRHEGQGRAGGHGKHRNGNKGVPHIARKDSGNVESDFQKRDRNMVTKAGERHQRGEREVKMRKSRPGKRNSAKSTRKALKKGHRGKLAGGKERTSDPTDEHMRENRYVSQTRSQERHARRSRMKSRNSVDKRKPRHQLTQYSGAGRSRSPKPHRHRYKSQRSTQQSAALHSKNIGGQSDITSSSPLYCPCERISGPAATCYDMVSRRQLTCRTRDCAPTYSCVTRERRRGMMCVRSVTELKVVPDLKWPGMCTEEAEERVFYKFSHVV